MMKLILQGCPGTSSQQTLNIKCFEKMDQMQKVQIGLPKTQVPQISDS